MRNNFRSGHEHEYIQLLLLACCAQSLQDRPHGIAPREHIKMLCRAVVMLTTEACCGSCKQMQYRRKLNECWAQLVHDVTCSWANCKEKLQVHKCLRFPKSKRQ